MVSLPPDPQIRSALTTSSYKETSLFVFCRLRWSLMNQWSQDVSPSMLPFAPAVKPPDDASTLKPALVGATETLQGVAALELPLKRVTVVPFPAALTPSWYQNEYRGEPDGCQPIWLIVAGE